jgi:preprotein translocase subunit SecG
MSTEDLPSPSWATKPKKTPHIYAHSAGAGCPDKGSPGARISAALATLFFFLSLVVGVVSERVELTIPGIFSALIFVIAAIHFHELRQQRVQAWNSHQVLLEIANYARRQQ